MKHFPTPTELTGSDNHCAVHAVRSVYTACKGKQIDEQTVINLVQQSTTGATIFGVASALQVLGIKCNLVLEKSPAKMIQLHHAGRRLALLYGSEDSKLSRDIHSAIESS
jgi:hypothetical protein